MISTRRVVAIWLLTLIGSVLMDSLEGLFIWNNLMVIVMLLILVWSVKVFQLGKLIILLNIMEYIPLCQASGGTISRVMAMDGLI